MTLAPCLRWLLPASRFSTQSVRHVRTLNRRQWSVPSGDEALSTVSFPVQEPPIAQHEAEELQKTQEVWDLVNQQIASRSHGRLFAVVLINGHQHKLTDGDLLMTNHDMGAPLGQRVRLEKLLLIGSKDFTLIGRPLLPRDLFRVEATIVEKNLSQTKVAQIFRKRKQYNKHYFNREFQTTLRINLIELLKPVHETFDRAGFEPNGYILK